MATETFTLRTPMPVSPDELYAWHARPAAFLRMLPPWEPAQLVGAEGTFGTDGHRLVIRTPVVGPVKGNWVAEGFDYQPGRGFRDRQLHGPFAEWTHAHRMLPGGPGGASPGDPNTSVLEDHVEYRLPLGVVGRLFGGGLVRDRLRAMFAYRHALLAGDLRRHARYRDRPRLKVVVTGSRGLIGTDLVAFLATGGHAVTRLVGGPSVQLPPVDDGTTYVGWDPAAGPDPAVLDGADAVVHLAGENVADGRWTDAKKKRIEESRTGPTRRLAEAVAALPAGRRPGVLVCASGISVYGDRGDESLTEDAAPGSGFLAGVVRAWEAATAPAADAGVRVVNLRFGVVLSPRAGALAKQLPAFRTGAGAVLGDGTQWVPWVELNDAVGAVHHALQTAALSGPVNVCAPNPVTNREFTKALGRALGRPAFLWLPRAALRAMFGEVADAALLASVRAVPRKLLDTGFAFDHPDLEPALRFALGR